MKFGVSSYVWVSPFSNHTIEQLKHAKELGFDIYEIGVEDPSSFDPAYVKHEADKAGIQVNICGAFGPERDISSDASRYRDKGMEYIRTLIDMASVFGSPYVAGPMYAATGKAGVASEEERTRQRSYAVDNLRAVAGYAATKGIRLALEPLNRFETYSCPLISWNTSRTPAPCSRPYTATWRTMPWDSLQSQALNISWTTTASMS